MFLFVLLMAYFGQTLEVHVAENQSFLVEDSTVFFLGHSTSIWDASEKTKAANKTLIALRNKYQIKTIATVYPYFLTTQIQIDSHYFTNSDVDLVVSSVAGQHSAEFPNLKKIFVVGGNIGKCLCEGVRDIVRGVTNSKNFTDVDIYLLRDGIYDGWPPFAPMQLKEALGFVTRFYLPSFKCSQNWYLKPDMRLEGVKLVVDYDGDLLGELDLEPRDTLPLESHKKTIRLHFIESQKVEGYLK